MIKEEIVFHKCKETQENNYGKDKNAFSNIRVVSFGLL